MNRPAGGSYAESLATRGRNEALRRTRNRHSGGEPDPEARCHHLPRASPMPRIRRSATLLLALVGAAASLPAQPPTDTALCPPLERATARTPRGGFDFTMFDAPYNVEHGLRGPSMRQSLDISVAAYEITHA